MATELPIRIKRELEFHFRDTRFTLGNPTCVVTANRDYTWHHLNHNHDDHRVSNIVPLIQRLNKNLFDAMSEPALLSPQLECEALKNRADRAFWEDGQVARAFGCIRIAYYVAQYKKTPFSEQMDWARQALYFARHKPNYQILEDLLGETILEPLDQNPGAIGAEVVRSLLQEFEALLTLGGDAEGAVSLSEYSLKTAPPQDRKTYAGAMRRRAHSRGTRGGPTGEVIQLLQESADIAPDDVNQRLNVVSSMNSLYLGEDTVRDHRKAMEIASEEFADLLGSKIEVHDGLLWPKDREGASPTLPLRASPANLAHLSLVHAVELVMNKPRRWRESLSEAIQVTERFWDLAGAKIDGPGRGNWKRIIARLDSNDPLQLQLINLIKGLVAPPFPAALRRRIHAAAKKVVARLP